MLTDAGFADIRIQVKENAADVIKDWIPGSGAEKYVTSAYVTAVKPVGGLLVRDNVRSRASQVARDAVPQIQAAAAGGSCAPGA